MYHSDDTIAAIATAPGGALRGIVRLSGPATLAILKRCFHPCDQLALDDIRNASVVSGTIVPDESRLAPLPADVYLWPEGRSYTRQCMAEVHTVGAPPLLAAVLAAVCAAGARMAEPGEFTLRAFLAGRLDLTQAEAVLGVIDAVGQEQLERALAQMAGGLARPLSELRNSLLNLLADLEAGLDFVEEDIRFVTQAEIQIRLDEAAASVVRIGEQLASRRVSDERPKLVLVGRPNVGKSSLFNALATGSRALVSDQPGTTRDYLMAVLDFGALSCQLIDTAGLDASAVAGSSAMSEEVAIQAGHLAAEQVGDADIRLLCLDSTRPLDEWERRELDANPATRQVVVLTKCDAAGGVGIDVDEIQAATIRTSAVTGEGLHSLRQRIRDIATDIERGDAAAGLTAERCGESLRMAQASLVAAGGLNHAAAGDELVAAELRQALAELGKVAGAVYTDDILDRVFSRFCIGK